MHVIVIEDSDEDFYSFKRALQRAGVARPPLRFSHGAEFLTLLVAGRGGADERVAHLIVLDLNLPGVGGLELIHRIRQAEGFAAVPVVIFSTSTSPRDIEESYARGADCYVVKPLQLDAFEAAVKGFVGFYMRVASAYSES